METAVENAKDAGKVGKAEEDRKVDSVGANVAEAAGERGGDYAGALEGKSSGALERESASVREGESASAREGESADERRADPAADQGDLEGKVLETLKSVYDPEIPVNIYELGLIYKIDVNNEGVVDVVMTLTAPGCPVAFTMPGEIEDKLRTIPGVSEAHVQVVWEPPWNKDMMSEAAKLQLGFW